MIRSRHPLPRLLAVGGVILLLAACEGPTTTEVEPLRPSFSTSSGPVLVECPTAETRSVTQTVGAMGGTISLDGHSITLPMGAVMMPTTIELTVPASRFVELQFRANGAESFEFRSPVSIAISYARCTRETVDKEVLTAWKIDPATKALIQDMGGVKNADALTVEFESTTFSNYAIAN